MFNSKKADVLGHWYVLVPNFNASTKDFYSSVESELKDRQVPGLNLAHEEFAEGGLLSDKRQYLRMTRERLVFDVCAAPFGKSFFFSCRFVELPLVIKLSELIFLGLVLTASCWIAWKLFGFWMGSFALLALSILLFYVLRNTVAMGLEDIDARLIKSPIGSIYETWFRKETYYRQDTRLMYCDTVDAVVKAQVEEITAAKGIKLIRYNETSPILKELYKPQLVALAEKERESAPKA